jgi:hypothetical protein
LVVVDVTTACTDHRRKGAGSGRSEKHQPGNASLGRCNSKP